MHYIGNTPTAPAATITVGTSNITDGSVTLVKLDRTGVAGQVLTANGAGVAPSWQTPSAASTLPAGMVVPFAGATAPTGWLLCDGSAVSRTTYATLYAAIGVTYGLGNLLTTFNLPDMRGRVAAGKDNMGGTSANRLVNALSGGTLGATGGAERHTLSVSEMPAHTHSIGISGNGGGGTTNGGASTLGQTGSQGGGASHNNTQPTMVLNYIIKT